MLLCPTLSHICTGQAEEKADDHLGSGRGALYYHSIRLSCCQHIDLTNLTAMELCSVREALLGAFEVAASLRETVEYEESQ